jgi:hypothetical protein
MITVSLLEPNWKTKFEEELSKIGLTKCKPRKSTDTGSIYKHGSRTFKVDENFKAFGNKKFRKMFSRTDTEISFDVVAFEKYIEGMRERAREKHSLENIIKFNQEFFQIRLAGLLNQIHPSVSNIKFEHNTNPIRMITCKFKIHRLEFVLQHFSGETISEISGIDYMENGWTLFGPTTRKSYGIEIRDTIIKLSTLNNILEILSNEELKKYSEEQIGKIDSKKLSLEENNRAISWMKTENEKYIKDISTSEEQIIKKMKETYETFRHRTSENKLGKSITTGEEGIPET